MSASYDYDNDLHRQEFMESMKSRIGELQVALDQLEAERNVNRVSAGKRIESLTEPSIKAVNGLIAQLPLAHQKELVAEFNRLVGSEITDIMKSQSSPSEFTPFIEMVDEKTKEIGRIHSYNGSVLDAIETRIKEAGEAPKTKTGQLANALSSSYRTGRSNNEQALSALRSDLLELYNKVELITPEKLVDLAKNHHGLKMGSGSQFDLMLKDIKEKYEMQQGGTTITHQHRTISRPK